MKIIQLPLNNRFFDMWLRHRARHFHILFAFREQITTKCWMSPCTETPYYRVELVSSWMRERERVQRRKILSRIPRSNAAAHGMRWQSRDDKLFFSCTIPASRTIDKLVFNFIAMAYLPCYEYIQPHVAVRSQWLIRSRLQRPSLLLLYKWCIVFIM